MIGTKSGSAYSESVHSKELAVAISPNSYLKIDKPEDEKYSNRQLSHGKVVEPN